MQVCEILIDVEICLHSRTGLCVLQYMANSQVKAPIDTGILHINHTFVNSRYEVWNEVTSR